MMDRLMATMTRLRSFLEANRELYAARIVYELQWEAHALWACRDSILEDEPEELENDLDIRSSAL